MPSPWRLRWGSRSRGGGSEGQVELQPGAAARGGGAARPAVQQAWQDRQVTGVPPLPRRGGLTAMRPDAAAADSRSQSARLAQPHTSMMMAPIDLFGGQGHGARREWMGGWVRARCGKEEEVASNACAVGGAAASPARVPLLPTQRQQRQQRPCPGSHVHCQPGAQIEGQRHAPVEKEKEGRCGDVMGEGRPGGTRAAQAPASPPHRAASCWVPGAPTPHPHSMSRPAPGPPHPTPLTWAAARSAPTCEARSPGPGSCRW